MLKRRGNSCFHVVLTWNTRVVFEGKRCMNSTEELTSRVFSPSSQLIWSLFLLLYVVKKIKDKKFFLITPPGWLTQLEKLEACAILKNRLEKLENIPN